MDKKTDSERLAVIETHVLYIRENMEKFATKTSVSYLKWVVGGIAGLSLTALLIACKVY